MEPFDPEHRRPSPPTRRGVLSILAVWDFIVRDDLVWRAFSTMLIVALATWVFNQVNERFGE